MTTHRQLSSARGSALITTVMFSAILAICIASILSWVRAERRLDQRQFLRLEARNAAEALAEWGFYQVRAKVQNASAYTTSMFQPSGGSALTLPSSATSFFTGSDVTSTSVELFGGATPSQTSYYVDPNDPNNLGDPLKGKFIFRRNIPVYAKATVSTTNGGPPISAYVSEVISIRGAPLFAHAIFYNMDLEINPGPDMTISGPVHANGNIFACSTGGNLTFASSVTCTGNIYHGWKYVSTSTIGTGAAGAGSGMNTNTYPVYINDATGTARNLYGVFTSSKWGDSTMSGSTAINGTLYANQTNYLNALKASASANQTSYRTSTTGTFGGYVQTVAMGVQNYTPAAIGAYSEQSGNTTASTDDSVNSARTIVEPPVASAASQYNSDVESQKFSTQACVYVQIVPSTVGATVTSNVSGNTTTTVTTYPTGTIAIYTGGPPGSGHLVVNPSISNLVTYKPYKETKVTTGSNTTYTVNNGMYDQHNGNVTSSTNPVGDTNGNMDIVELDMNGLRNVVTQLTAGTPDTTKALDGLSTTNWNGIVYLEVNGGPTTNTVATGNITAGSTVAATNSRAANTGVRIINGTGSVATYGTATPGLTIATNAPLYVKGNYNADGTVGSTSPTAIDTGEKPACLAADAITLLSGSWNDTTSKSSARPVLATGTTVEVAAALLTGITPTNKNGNAVYSGGANNLPRFLEDWSTHSAKTYIRGSLVCLYESRVATVPFSTNYYKPPDRQWGFSDLFKSGSYPPGTPKVMSYRRIDYTDLSASDYATAKAANP